ncbi:sensor histidine kinase [Allomuricauda sp. F6463D]|uniref:tetratricopeptide repeat-containing sensor histidine kinase n=1 Tax=Allomuricauda sp. F6463D TaxID=2926409 RepID=UPI001FF20D42|nr:sensor histidine kinase [Muricauda sp. F6463D]MCK0159785.1 sensor histidine kinase [Muricauda sp. F6463D]
MRNVTHILIFLFFWSCTQNIPKEQTVSDPTIDSIQELIRTARTAKELTEADRKAYLNDAVSKSMKLTNDTIKLKQLSRVSYAFMQLKDSTGFRSSNTEVVKMASKLGENKALGYSHWDLASFLMANGVLDSAFYHYRKALSSFEQLPTDSTSQSLRGRMLYSMARVQDSYKDYLGGEASATAAIELFNELEDNYRLYNAYNILGILANGMGNNEKAIESYEEAKEYLDKSNAKNKTELVWQVQNNIANVHLNSNDFVKAKQAYTAILNNKGLIDKKTELYEKALGGLAYSTLKADKDVERADELLNEALLVNKNSGKAYDRARLNYYKAEILAAKGDTLQAIARAKESYAIARGTYNNGRSLDALQLLTQLDVANAYTHADEYYQLNETIKEEERTKRDKFARIRMETDDIIEENQILTKEKQAWVGAALLLIIFGVAFMIIVSLYVNNNQLKFRQKQQESNQEIYNLMLSQRGKFEEGKQLEQKRISEELHDGILGEMLGIRLILSGLNEREDQASIEQRAALIEKLRDLEEEIRTISHELNHASYKKFHNFIVSLEDMIEDIQKSSGISCTFEYDKKIPWDSLLGDIKINAYRIVQESLKNCVKHAKSQNASISFQSLEDNLKLTITDNGIGFDPNKKKKGIGLRNIISRVKKIKGILDIDSKPGKGTTIKITIPAKYVEFEVSDKKSAINV